MGCNTMGLSDDSASDDSPVVLEAKPPTSGNDARPGSRGSRSYQSSVTPLFRGTKPPKALVLLCVGKIREGRMIRDRLLLTS